MKPLRIVADRHIWHVDDAFSHLPDYRVSLDVMEADEIQASTVRDADVLLVRSSTRVNASLLAGSAVRFVATATVGDDHIDLPYLQQQGIVFASAAGSSTGSVIEYMMTALLQLHAMKHLSLVKHSLGVIGVGRIGSRLVEVCQGLAIKVLLNDPPRAIHKHGNTPWKTLDELLAQADVLTLHTPLIRHGKDSTHHLINADALAKFRGFGIINAARGACIDNHALLDWLNQDQQHWAVLDCWEREPTPDQALLQHPKVVIGTPHIAGHSLDGKANNTRYVYIALCKFLDCTPLWQMSDALPEARASRAAPAFADPWAVLQYISNDDYPIMNDHQVICQHQSMVAADAFQYYRRHYPIRRDWSFCHWSLADQKNKALLQTLGYSVSKMI